jgi:glycosyltransferase involved in cell wall biosynthesis
MNENLSKISIVVPIFNTSVYLIKCLDSIQNQTYKNIEVIMVNDGSTDNSIDICSKYTLNDIRFKLINKKNGGLADARNAGIQEATGHYIGFVDSDDYIELDMYEELLKGLITTNSKISICGRFNVSSKVITQQFTFDSYRVWSSKEAIINLLNWHGIDSSVCDKLFYKSLFSKVRFPVGFYNEDVAIIGKLILNSESICNIGKAKYYYLKRDNSITNQPFNIKKLDIFKSNELLINEVKTKYKDLNLLLSTYRYKGILYINELLQRENKSLSNLKLSKDINPRFLIKKYLFRMLFIYY